MCQRSECKTKILLVSPQTDEVGRPTRE